MLSRYGTSKLFGEFLKSLTFNLRMTKLNKMSVHELQDTLIRVRTSIANNNQNSIWEASINGGLNVSEKIVANSKLGQYLHIEGLTEFLQEDECWQDLIEEISLEYQDLGYVSPQVRLAYTILSTGAQVHALNTVKRRVLAPKKPEPEVQETKAKKSKKAKEKTITTKKGYVPINDRIIDLPDED
jgi:hypothetical protein